MATLAMLFLCTAIYYFPDDVDTFTDSLGVREITSIRSNSILPLAILRRFEIRRLITAAFIHLDDMHIYYNMMSLLWKGVQLEGRLGTPRFAALSLGLVAACHSLMVAIALFFSKQLGSNDMMVTRTAGISGLLFAFKAILNMEANPNDIGEVHGFAVPIRYVAWAELLLIHIMVPNSSFAAHFCGLVVGLAYVFGRRALAGRGLIDRHAPFFLALQGVLAFLGLNNNNNNNSSSSSSARANNAAPPPYQPREGQHYDYSYSNGSGNSGNGGGSGPRFYGGGAVGGERRSFRLG